MVERGLLGRRYALHVSHTASPMQLHVNALQGSGSMNAMLSFSFGHTDHGLLW